MFRQDMTQGTGTGKSKWGITFFVIGVILLIIGALFLVLFLFLLLPTLDMPRVEVEAMKTSLGIQVYKSMVLGTVGSLVISVLMLGGGITLLILSTKE